MNTHPNFLRARAAAPLLAELPILDEAIERAMRQRAAGEPSCVVKLEERRRKVVSRIGELLPS